MANLIAIVTLALVTGSNALTTGEEKRLILHDDVSVIEERLRELPGGVLLPPEVEVEGVPRMEELGEEELLSHHHHHTPHTHTLLKKRAKSHFTHSSPAPLEIALKRVEILASRAGFNLSSVPRRTQLQIVTRIAPKLPEKLGHVVRKALKNDVKEIYKLLPEPGRDPLVEDVGGISTGGGSLGSGGEEESEEEVVRRFEEAMKESQKVEVKLKNGEKNDHRDEYEMIVNRRDNQHGNHDEKILGNEKTHHSNHREFRRQEDSHEKNHKKYDDNHKQKKPQPIRVSIISKETPTTTPPPTTTTPPTTTPTEQEIKKYVQVQDFQNKTNFLFALDKNASNEDYDLSSSEIAAMVTELRKFEEEEEDFGGGGGGGGPHPLDFPDHPQHLEIEEEMEELRRLREERKRLQQQLRRIPGPHPPGPHPHHRPHPLKTAPPNCDYFSPDICLITPDYPVDQIKTALKTAPPGLLPPEESPTTTPPPSSDKISGEGGFLCPSKVAYGRIKRGRSSTSGRWKWVVNTDDKSQTLRIEKCLTPGNKCSYVLPHYRTACTQVYSYHRLLAWEPERGLHLDVFKIPTVCTCHVQGYYAKPHPPPLPHHGQRPHPVSQLLRRRSSTPPINQQRNFPQQPSPPSFHDYELDSLLRQYNTLREKIQKKKDLAQQKTIRRRKRKNSSSPENLKKFLKKLSRRHGVGAGGKRLPRAEIVSIARRRLKSFEKRSRRGKSLNLKKKEKFLELLRKIKSKRLS